MKTPALSLVLALVASAVPAAEPDLIPRPAVVEWGGGTCTPAMPPREVTDPALPDEGYVLDLAQTGATVRAAGPAGFFRARQTLAQLGGPPWPALHIEDAPRFRWRGLMLDASRHFQTVDEVKRLLDRMARYQLNVLHWHLTDGHGWRIEIQRYPRLIAVGGFREQPPVGRYGGFYTQQEIRDVVAYAAARHITIVPEIEMPGHSRAAVAAYPELGCPQAPQPVDFFFDFPCPAQRFPAVPGTDVLCTSRETTFTFLTNVLTEVMALFPSTFIHVGGDEVNFASWNACTNCQALRRERGLKNGHAQQSWFMQRVDNFLTSHDRRLIGWDEILDGGLASNATVMSWRGTEGGVAAARSGHDAVMSPGHPLYFDHGQSPLPGEPAHWPGTETLEQVYRYEPVPAGLTADEARHILGPQANLWTCFTHTEPLLEVQLFPRLLALAEAGWTPAARRDWSSFTNRLVAHRRWLDAQGIAQWVEPPPAREIGRWAPETVSTNEQRLAWDVTAALAGPAPLSVVFDYESGAHKLDIRRAELREDGRVVASEEHAGFTGWRDEHNAYPLPLAAYRAGARYEVAAWVRSDGGNDSRGRVVLQQGGWRAPERPPVPALRTTTPVTQDRDRATYNWQTRHGEVLALNAQGPVDAVMIGDSITHYWGGRPAAPHAWSTPSWARAFGGRSAVNLGFGWDRTENVLWRLDHGEIDGLKPKVAVLLIGTNNFGQDPEEEIAWGIEAICRRIHERSPATRILVLGVLPRPAPAFAGWSGPDKVNYFLQTRVHDLPYADVLDVGNEFRAADGSVDRQWFRDGVHLNDAGYQRLAARIAAVLDAWLPPKT